MKDKLEDYIKANLYRRKDGIMPVLTLHRGFLATLPPDEAATKKWLTMELLQSLGYLVGVDARGQLCVAGVTNTPPAEYVRTKSGRLKLVKGKK